MKAGVEVRRVKSYQNAVAYVSKYVAKKADGQGDEHYEVGRWWGTAGNVTAHLAEVVTLALTRSQVSKLVRVLDAMRLSRARAKVKGRGPAVRRARRRRVLRFSMFWFVRPDELVRRIAEIVGKS